MEVHKSQASSQINLFHSQNTSERVATKCCHFILQYVFLSHMHEFQETDSGAADTDQTDRASAYLPFLCFKTICGQESGLPTTPNGWREVITFWQNPCVQHSFFLQLFHKLWPLFCHLLIYEMTQEYGCLPTFCWLHLTVEKELPRILWHLEECGNA